MCMRYVYTFTDMHLALFLELRVVPFGFCPILTLCMSMPKPAPPGEPAHELSAQSQYATKVMAAAAWENPKLLATQVKNGNCWFWRIALNPRALQHPTATRPHLTQKPYTCRNLLWPLQPHIPKLESHKVVRGHCTGAGGTDSSVRLQPSASCSTAGFVQVWGC